MSLASKMKIVGTAMRSRIEHTNVKRSISKKLKNKMFRVVTNLISKAMVAQCPRCREWFPSYDLRNDHKKNGCKELPIEVKINNEDSISFELPE